MKDVQLTEGGCEVMPYAELSKRTISGASAWRRGLTGVAMKCSRLTICRVWGLGGALRQVTVRRRQPAWR